MKRILAGLALAFLLASPVYAARITGTVTVDQPELHYGDSVTFSVVTNAPVTIVGFQCYQGGTFVLWGGGIVHREPVYTTRPDTLSSLAYTGGAADCTATLRSYRNNHEKVLDTVDFEVLP